MSPAPFKRDLEYLRSRLNIPIVWDREANGYRYDPRYDSYYRGGYYRDGYYDRGRRYAYRTCITRDRVYDPYIGRRVTIERRYAC